MTDRELLELAALAAGYGEPWTLPERDCFYIGPKYKLGAAVEYKVWNPIADDGDALRLAVALRLPVSFATLDGEHEFAVVGIDGDEEILEPIEECQNAATRYAIVRAAAEIGKSMTGQSNHPAKVA